jgi:hypothetical protein
MGRRKREGNYTPQNMKYCMIKSDMKKTDSQTQNPIKQR